MFTTLLEAFRNVVACAVELLIAVVLLALTAINLMALSPPGYPEITEAGSSASADLLDGVQPTSGAVCPDSTGEPECGPVCQALTKDFKLAIWYKHADSVKRYLAYDVHLVDPNGRNRTCQTPLMMAAMTGSPEIAQLLIGAGADPNAADNFSGTPLMYAAREGHPLTVRTLIQAGAAVNFRNAHGWSAVMYAAQQNHPRTTRMLLASGASVKRVISAALTGAAERGESEYVKKLLRKGADPNFRSDEFRTDYLYTPLILVTLRDVDYENAWIWDAKIERMVRYRMTEVHQKPSTKDYFKTMRALIAAGADVNLRGSAGSFPLLQARVLDAVDLLIRSGADVNAQDVSGNTALLLRAGDDTSGELVRQLLKAGANPNLANKDGYTPLHQAAMAGSEQAAKALLASGANLNAKNANGDTPLAVAKKTINKRVIQLLSDAASQESRP